MRWSPNRGAAHLLAVHLVAELADRLFEAELVALMADRLLKDGVPVVIGGVGNWDELGDDRMDMLHQAIERHFGSTGGAESVTTITVVGEAARPTFCVIEPPVVFNTAHRVPTPSLSRVRLQRPRSSRRPSRTSAVTIATTGPPGEDGPAPPRRKYFPRRTSR